MKTKLSKMLLTTVLTSAMALGTGISVAAQDQSTDKPSAGVSAPVDQAPPTEQPAPQNQNNDPQYSAPDQSAPQAVAPAAPQDQGTYQGQAQAPPPPMGPDQRQFTPLPSDQLDKLVAPIALYPDALVAQILAASGYPTQIVEADRMVRDYPQLKGKDLAQEADARFRPHA